MITALLIGAGALWLLRRKHTQAVGKVERVKRRIYKEVSMAQQAGVDFSKKFPELTTQERQALERVGHDVGWKQSKRSVESGKPYVESYYGSLRRAWNAVSGISGIGTIAYDVRDRDGNVVLTWTDVTDHIEHEPEAKVLLALPPHVEQKKSKAKRTPKVEQKEQELKERFNWAFNFIKAYMDFSVSYPIEISTQLVNALNHRIEKMGDSALYADLVIWAWAHKKFKIHKRDNVVTFTCELDGKEYGASTYGEGEIFEILDKCWKMYLDDSGWRENADKIDDIRKELLDRAKLMRIHVPDDQIKFYEERGLLDETTHPYRDRSISGENRYQAMDLINWILWVHQHYERGGDTYYPKYAFDTKEDALRQTGGKMSGNGFKIIPVWDVPIEKITGFN